MGIGSKCVSDDFQELSFSNFQAFLRRGCTSFNPFLSNLDNSPHLTMFYSRLNYLQVTICAFINAQKVKVYEAMGDELAS